MSFKYRESMLNKSTSESLGRVQLRKALTLACQMNLIYSKQQCSFSLKFIKEMRNEYE